MSILQTNCRDFFTQKTILITGCTGFIGKVLLEKILRTLNIKKIYVMIRAKGKDQLSQRFMQTIFQSKCFDRLRQQEGEKFEDFILQHVEAIQGDFCEDNLGMTELERQQLINTVNVIVNSAGSVEFNLPLKRALEINFYGNLKMMQLAQQCKQLEIFIHVSTAYVNSNQFGEIKEQIYNEQSNILNYANMVYNRAEMMSEKEKLKLFNGLPNTYTFSKHLAEQMYKQLRPSQMALSIIRPSIVGCALREPEIGWIDSYASSAAVLLNSGNGMFKFFKCNPNMQSCHIPVDMFVDQVIAISAHDANRKQFKIYHSGCSDRNPNYLFWRVLDREVKDFWTEHKAKKRISEPKVVTTNNQINLRLMQIQCLMMARLGVKIAQKIGNDESIKQSQINLKNIEKCIFLGNILKFFTQKEWIFKSSNMTPIINNLSESDQTFLSIDVSTVDWNVFFYIYNYGIQKYLLGENIQLKISHKQSHQNIDEKYEQNKRQAKL